MRVALDTLYRICGGLAAVFLAGIAILILTQIIGRFFNVLIPSAIDFAGFSMAASSFLALAYTFRNGSHIRVSLLLQRLPLRWRRRCDLLSLAIAAAMIAYFTWSTVGLTLESLHYHDLSDGLIPVPLWIPQSVMAFGLAVLAIALIDEFVHVLRGGEPSFESSLDVVLQPRSPAPGD